MAKRFADTDIWQKEWFLKLSLRCKMLVKFLFDNCDCAGIYEPNFTLLSFYIGEQITEKDFEEIKQVKKLENGNYFIEDFIKFQYNTTLEELNPKFSVHKGIIKQLEKNNITLTQPLPNPLIGVSQPLQDMDKDKDMDKVNNSSSLLLSSSKKKTDPTMSEAKRKFVEEYQKVFKARPFLSWQDQLRITELSAQYEDFVELIPSAISRLKNIDFKDIDFKPTATWLLKGNNFERVMNGEFDKKETSTQDVLKAWANEYKEVEEL